MRGFVKLFSSILMSSVWEQPSDTRVVWFTLLAMADQRGKVEATPMAIARLARVTQDATDVALAVLASPDPDDRSGVNEGRRIVAVQGGWMVVNYALYRQRMTQDARMESERQRKRDYRAAMAANRAREKEAKASAASPQTGAMSGKAEAEAEADKSNKLLPTPDVPSNNKLNGKVCVGADAPTPPPPDASADVFLTFPTRGLQSEWVLTFDQLERWEAMFRTLNVREECLRALAWAEAAGNDQKTAKTMERFLVGWLNKEVRSRPAVRQRPKL